MTTLTADRAHPLRPALRPQSPARSAPPLRLTRRGRFVLWAVAWVLGATATVVAVLVGGHVARAGSAAGTVSVEYRVVGSGETLWQIAGEVAPQADRRSTVARIVELNALPSTALRAGQRIAVPAAP